MERKYTVLVVNDIFEDENMMIVKSSGSTYTKRYDEKIKPEELSAFLEGEGINIDDCKIYVTEKGWKGHRITEY